MHITEGDSFKMTSHILLYIYVDMGYAKKLHELSKHIRIRCYRNYTKVYKVDVSIVYVFTRDIISNLQITPTPGQCSIMSIHDTILNMKYNRLQISFFFLDEFVDDVNVPSSGTEGNGDFPSTLLLHDHFFFIFHGSLFLYNMYINLCSNIIKLTSYLHNKELW